MSRRCAWAGDDPLYVLYHDEEWGVPVRDDRDLFLWSFVDGTPIQNAWERMDQLPAETERSGAMSRVLERRGFSFVGPTICYAFMQAVGTVNDHVVSCHRYEAVRAPGTS